MTDADFRPEHITTTKLFCDAVSPELLRDNRPSEARRYWLPSGGSNQGARGVGTAASANTTQHHDTRRMLPVRRSRQPP